MKEKNKLIKSSKEKAKLDEERAMLIAKADMNKGEQIRLFPDGLAIENELKSFAIGNIDNPEKKYDLLYKGIMKLLRTYLPKGKENKQARNYIYEEKNTFLTRGKRINIYGLRGADSRMSYITEIEELLDVIMKWIAARGTTADLFNILRQMNIDRGYGEREL